jgi:hypothetical protein
MPQSRWTEIKINLHRNPLHKTSDIPGIDADDSNPSLFSSVHSQVDVAPASSPTRATNEPLAATDTIDYVTTDQNGLTSTTNQ